MNSEKALLSGKHIIFGDNNEKLSGREYDLLMLFLNNKNKTFSRDNIMNEVWGSQYYAHKNVEMTICRIKKRMKKAGLSSSPIDTIRGEGYKFSNNIEFDVVEEEHE